MRNIDVIVSPNLVSTYNLKNKLVVVIDVFRATTTIVTAMANGVKKVKPCLDVATCIALKKEGYMAGGERNGEMVIGMDVDNSPLSFINNSFADKKLAISTTNGTRAIEESLGAKEIIIGAFTNLTAITEYITQSDLDVVFVCAGWKGKMCTEDLLFAGAVLSGLSINYKPSDDVTIAKSFFSKNSLNFSDTLNSCEHALRLKKLNKQLDIDFCMQKDVYAIVPKYHFTEGVFVL